MTILDPVPIDQLPPLPPQPAGVPWPTREWPTGSLPDQVDPAALEGLLAQAFGSKPDPSFGASYATVIVHQGRIVAERYGPDITPETPLLSWSMAKSVTHSLVGILVAQGRLELDTPAPVEAWQTDASDPRSRLTLRHLLRMADGLDFNEEYTLDEAGESHGPDDPGWSHCIDMLFGAGAGDVAGYAAARPARHEPGTTFNYSSGTTNIVARIIGDLIGGPEEMKAWMDDVLFHPIGIRSAEPTFDTVGTFVGSSYLHMTARDWARFGLLHLRGGQWDGTQVVPREWIDDERRAWAVDDEGSHYGTHWWVADDGRGTFFCSGFELQRVLCVPSGDLVVVRLGKTPESDYDTPKSWLEEMVSAFDA
ncbi:MAG: serine hydrolase [Acidimicrobiaceae bacterium]|nr:serine hydrolase [Acidimicrobiaceae bacterium]HAB58352.1 serine hydrolase [Acidimicrobiaceae bacterium]